MGTIMIMATAMATGMTTTMIIGPTTNMPITITRTAIIPSATMTMGIAHDPRQTAAGPHGG